MSIMSSCSTAEWAKLTDRKRREWGETRRRVDAYKTELCAEFARGNCWRGVECRYAHGEMDLRLRNRHPKYKTRLCRNFEEEGNCQYGNRCDFIHRSPPLPLPSAVPVLNNNCYTRNGFIASAAGAPHCANSVTPSTPMFRVTFTPPHLFSTPSPHLVGPPTPFPAANLHMHTPPPISQQSAFVFPPPAHLLYTAPPLPLSPLAFTTTTPTPFMQQKHQFCHPMPLSSPALLASPQAHFPLYLQHMMTNSSSANVHHNNRAMNRAFHHHVPTLPPLAPTPLFPNRNGAIGDWRTGMMSAAAESTKRQELKLNNNNNGITNNISPPVLFNNWHPFGPQQMNGVVDPRKLLFTQSCDASIGGVSGTATMLNGVRRSMAN